MASQTPLTDPVNQTDRRWTDPRHPSEAPLFVACLIISMIPYALVIAGLLAVIAREPRAAIGIIIAVVIYVPLGLLISVAVKAGFVTHVRGNGLMVGPDQLPRVHDAVLRAASALGCDVPQVFVVQFGGLRQAIAKIFVGSRILVLSSAAFDDNGEGPELDMLVGRELAHFRYRHIAWRFWLFPSMALPLLYPAWRRACEYTADRCGLLACGDAAAARRHLFISAAGGAQGRAVTGEVYDRQLADSGGFWMTLMHLLSAHPTIAWRVGQLARAIPGQAPPAGPRRSILATILCCFVPGAASQGGSAAGAAGGGLMSIAIVAMLVAFLLPTLQHARSSAQSALSASNLHVIGIGLRMYAAENNDDFPPSLAVLVQQGILSPKALVHPGSGHEPPKLIDGDLVGEVDYVYLGEGLSIRNCVAPAETIIAMEKPEIAQGDMVNVLYADAHVGRVPIEEVYGGYGPRRAYPARRSPAAPRPGSPWR